MTYARKLEVVGSFAYRILLASIYLFSIFPVLIVFVMAFGSSQQLQFPLTGITIKWYIRALGQYAEYVQPLLFSLWIAIVAAALSTILGILATFALVRFSPRFKNAIQGGFTAPLSIPQVVIGLAILIFFQQIDFSLGTMALIVGHAVIGIPFVVVFVSISLREYNKSLELSARDLGADRYRTIRHITLPLIKPGIFAGALLAFVMSYNNVPISLFLVKPGGETTLPLVIFQNLQFGFSPVLAAIAVIQVLIVILLIAAVSLVVDVSKIF
jgi:putative spermidine/putrescine transport system permease protein